MVSNWEEKFLDELCYIYIGKTPSRGKKIFWDKNCITDNTWLSIADLKNSKDKFVYSSKEQISNKGAEISKIVKKGTLLLSFKLTIGRVAFAGKDLYTNEAIAQLPIKEDKINIIDKNYLFYYLQYFDYDSILKGDIKVKGKTLNKKKLEIIPVIFPPMEEQKRIVEKLDNAFQKIEALENNTKENIKNIEDLYNSYLNRIFNENTDDWEEKKLEDLANFYRGLTYKKTDEVEYSSNIVLRANNIDLETNHLNFDELKYLREDFYIDDFKKVKKNSIIICTASGSKSHLGKVALIDNEYNYAFGGFMGMLIPKNNIYSKYLFYSLITERYKDYIDNIANGTNINNLKFSDISSFFIPLPPIEEQKKIVDKLDIFNNKIQTIKQNYQNKITLLDNLKKSILNKAFKGGV